MVKAVVRVLSELKGTDLALLLVEQNLQMALDIADRVVVLENGAVADTLTSSEARADPQRLEQFLSVH
jgi:branched-chain amino acid transport system ATP-binding protein